METSDETGGGAQDEGNDSGHDKGADENPFDVDRQRRQIASRQAHASGSTFESAIQTESAGGAVDVPADDVLQRVLETMEKMPSAEISNPGDFRYAMETVIRHGASGLRKLAEPAPRLSQDEGFALEAIIRADGSRPSFLLAQGKPPLDHPFMGMWENEIATLRDDIETVAKAVGRIQPGLGHATRYVGTGFLVSADPPLVMTNYHVLDDARTGYFVAMSQIDDELIITGSLEIDFEGEFSSLATNRFKCVKAWLPPGYGRVYAGLDAAIIQIEPLDDKARLPAPLRLSKAPGYAQGGVTSLCTIGFPAPPARTSGTTDGIDWGFVVATLFGGINKFGFKRLAPGRFQKALGHRLEDASKRAFAHDATTFGGASGSPVLAWNDPGLPGFGLHFAGADGDSNDALAFAAIASDLAGAPITFAS